jgi:hypothetical protein
MVVFLPEMEEMAVPLPEKEVLELQLQDLVEL